MVQIKVLNSASWTIEAIGDFVVTNTKLELNLHELSDLLHRIKTQEKFMQALITHFHHLENSTLEEFAYRTISLDTVQGYLDRIHVLVVGSNELDNVGSVGALHLLANSMEVSVLSVVHCYDRNFNLVLEHF